MDQVSRPTSAFFEAAAVARELTARFLRAELASVGE
jgi:hypothetical protein